jgi:hypothetical protein
VVSISDTPDINSDDWELLVNGLVENPMFLSYENITSITSKTETAKLKCVEGPSGTAVWKGVKLKTILEQASPSPVAKEVIFHAADGYTSSLTIDDATAEDVILAYEMNGEPLPADQGYPLRLVVPGKAGYKWVKWIERIEVVDYDYKGYWESRGWDDDAELASYSDWGMHAILLSIGFIFGGLSVISGYKNLSEGKILSKLPKFINRRFHRYISVVYLALLIIVFSYWVYTTFLMRGNIFYSVHGKLALLAIIMSILGGISSFSGIRNKRFGPGFHRNASMFGFILYTGVIAIGLLLAY